MFDVRFEENMKNWIRSVFFVGSIFIWFEPYDIFGISIECSADVILPCLLLVQIV